jgi:AraC family transcriptional regulator
MRESERAKTKPLAEDVVGIVPTSGLLSSEGRSWEGIAAARFRHRLDDIDLPPLSNHLVVVHQGRPSGVEERIDGRVARRYMSRGGVTIVPAGVATEWRWEEAPETLHAYLSPSLVERVATESGIDPDGVEIVDSLGVRDARIERLGAALLSELEGDGIGDKLYAESVASLLAVHLLREHSSLGSGKARKVAEASEGGLPAPALRRALDYVEENLPRGMTQAGIAAAAGFSPYHFARAFRRSTGLSPHRYVIARRVERAKWLLLKGDLPIAVVAREVGFADQAHLTRHVRALLGVTPRQILKESTNVQRPSTDLQDRAR